MVTARLTGFTANGRATHPESERQPRRNYIVVGEQWARTGADLWQGGGNERAFPGLSIRDRLRG
jgi:hypothetical protein